MNNHFTSIIGCWKLTEMESINERSEISFPWGRQLRGMLIYESTGFMSLQIFRTNHHNNNENFHSYFGEFEIDIKRKICIHKIECANRPEWIDSVQVRFFTVTQNELVLKSPPIMVAEFGEVLSFTTKWARPTSSK